MTESANPYAPPASGSTEAHDVDHEALGPVLETLRALSPDKLAVPWTITLHERHARFLEDGDGREFVVRRAEFPDRVGLAVFDQAILTVTPPDKVVLRTLVENARTIDEWLGRAGPWMKALLAKRRRFSGITLTVLAVFGLLDGSPFLLGYVAVSALLLLLSRIAPTRHLFLADAAMTLGFAAFFGWGIYTGDLSPWWALFLLLVAISLPLNVRTFGFFGPKRAHT